MNSRDAILTVLSAVAYCAVVVMLWRFSIQPSASVRVRTTLRLFAAALLFVLVLLWTAD